MRLEGRVAGPWASELDRVWLEAAPRLQSKKLVIDLHNVTYADASGKQVLRDIYAQTNAELVASTPWTQFLAEEVTANKVVAVEEGE
jgi:anti-anti-sigma regulatory factor